jgi:outer membrane lipoprotein-sorting protein
MNTYEHLMNKITLSIKGVILILALLFPVVGGSIPLLSDSPALSQLKSRFSDDILFRAEMSHHFTDSYTGEVTDSYGTIWFNRDKYKIETPDQIILVRDLTSTVYNKAQRRVIISHYDPEEDEFAPSRYFASSRDTYRSQDISNNDGSTTILITSDDPFEIFSEVKIRVTRDGQPSQIEAIDQMDNEIRTTFRFGRFERVQESVFAISYPADSEIVDLRQ